MTIDFFQDRDPSLVHPEADVKFEKMTFLKSFFVALLPFALSLPAFSQSEEKLLMICEPQPEFVFPEEIVSRDIYLYGGPGQKRTLEVTLNGELLRVDLHAISTREFMGFSGPLTVFFEQENDFYVKMILSFSNLSTMENIGPLKLNCYLNL